MRNALGIFSLAIAVRILYIFWLAPVHHADPGEMERAAANLARHGQIGNVFSDDSGPSAHVGPVYVLILAAIYRLSGDGFSRTAQKLFSTLVSSLLISFMPALGRRLQLRPSTGTLAGVCLAISPLFWFDETSGSWEQPLTGLALAAVTWFFATLHEQQWQVRRTVVLAGILTGVLALLSPAMLPAVVLMFLVEWRCQRGQRRRTILGGATIVGISMVIVFPWAYRNYALWNGFIPFRSNFGLELRIGNNPKATGKSAGTYWHDSKSPFATIHPLTNPEELARLKEVGEWEYMQEKERQALNWIKENPGRTLELTGRRLVLYWFAPGHVFEPGTSLIPIRTILFSLTTLFCLVGLIYLMRQSHPSTGLLISAIAGGSLVYFLTHIDMRYRYPVFGLSVLVGCNWIFAMKARILKSGRTGDGTIAHSASTTQI